MSKHFCDDECEHSPRAILGERIELLEQALMAGAFEEGRLRGTLEQIADEMPGFVVATRWAEEALSAPTLEEGSRE